MGASTGSALLVPQFSPPIIFYLFKKKNLNLGEKLGEKRRTPIFLPTQKPLSLSLSGEFETIFSPCAGCHSVKQISPVYTLSGGFFFSGRLLAAFSVSGEACFYSLSLSVKHIYGYQDRKKSHYLLLHRIAFIHSFYHSLLEWPLLMWFCEFFSWCQHGTRNMLDFLIFHQSISRKIEEKKKPQKS